MISSTIRPYLADIEARIDPLVEDALHQEWIDFSDGRSNSPVFSPRRARPCPPGIQWPKISINTALADRDAMVLQQFGFVSEELASGSGLLLNVRCNYGSSILPSLFGVEDYMMEDTLDTLPTSRPLNNLDAIQRVLDRGIPELNGGWGAKVFAMGDYFNEIARAYPKIGRWVSIYHPDCQGPLDTVEVVWGSSLFYALVDQPDLVHAMLGLVTETYIRFMRTWAGIVPFYEDGNTHWGYYHKGCIMLRDDSAMNLSPAMVGEFVVPYDQRLLDVFGGGAVHFCGHGDHHISRVAAMRGVNAIHLSQPELNNMEKVFTHTIDRGVPLLGLRREAAEAALARGRDLRARVHVI